MSATVTLKNANLAPEPKLSVETLSLINAYLDELICEEGLNYGTQVLLRRIAPSICLLANSVEDIFRKACHPARGIFDAIVKIAKLSGGDFTPGDVLYQTVTESIQTLQSRQVSGMDTLKSVQSDLEYVLKLAKIRAPAEARNNAEFAGRISAAKVIASLMILSHARRFHIDDDMLYFILTQWLEFVVVTVLQKGHESVAVRGLDRLTFTLFYLNSGKAGEKRIMLLRYFLPKLEEMVSALEPTCMGYNADFSSLRVNLSPFLDVNRGL